MKQLKGMIRDTAIMTAVSMVMQTVAVGFNLYLNRKIGTAGMGVFQLIMTVYGMSITFSSAGTRLAAARLTAEQVARGNRGASTLPACTIYAIINSVCISIILYIASGYIAGCWIDDTSAGKALRILALSLPFVATSCVLSGYFTAQGFASPYYGIRLCEQLCKIGVTVLLLNSIRFIEAPTEAMVTGITASEALSVLLAFAMFLRAVKKEKHLPKAVLRLRYLLRIALPDLCGASARSVLLTIEHLLIPKAFERSGATKETSLAAYGTIHAVALPVLLWPGALLQSAAALIIPKAAEENAVGNTKGIEELSNKLMHLTAVFSVSCSVVFLFFAKPLVDAMGSQEAEHYLIVLAPLVPIMYCDMTTDALLRGLDQQLHSMIYNIADSALCVILVITLLPRYAISGYIFILYISEIINFYLSIRRLIRTVSLRFSPYQSMLKPALCAVAGCLPFVPYTDRMCTSKIWTGFGIACAAGTFLTLQLLTGGKGQLIRAEQALCRRSAQ